MTQEPSYGNEHPKLSSYDTRQDKQERYCRPWGGKKKRLPKTNRYPQIKFNQSYNANKCFSPALLNLERKGKGGFYLLLTRHYRQRSRTSDLGKSSYLAPAFYRYSRISSAGSEASRVSQPPLIWCQKL